MSDKAIRKLRDQVEKLRQKGQWQKALDVYRDLVRLDPANARWPHQIGELLQRLGEKTKAAQSFMQAAEKYYEQGFGVQAVALAKMAMDNDGASTAPTEFLRRLSESQQPRVAQLASLELPEGFEDQGGAPSLGAAGLFGGASRSGLERPAATGTSSDPRFPQAAPYGGGAQSGFGLQDRQGAPFSSDSQSGSDLEAAPAGPHASGTEPRRSGPPPLPSDVFHAVPQGRGPGAPPRVRPRSKGEMRQQVKLHSGDTLDGLKLRDVVGSSQELPAVGDEPILSTPQERIDAVEHARTEVSMVRAVSAFEVPIMDSGVHDGMFAEQDALAGRHADRGLSSMAKRPGGGALKRTPLFGELSPEALDRLVQRMKLRRVQPGIVVVREGDPGGELFVVTDGVMQVVREGPPRVILSTLRAGDFFGEIALVTELPRQATVQAVTETTLLEIDRDLVVDLIQEYPETVAVLLKFFRRRMVQNFLKTSPLFATLDDALRAGLVREFKFLEVDPGVRFIKQGKPIPGLFLILSGTVRISVVKGAVSRILAELGTGDVVGETALLSGQEALASVTASSKCWMLFMPSKVFRQKAVLIPEVVSYLRQLWTDQFRAAEAPSGRPVEFPVERLPVY
ncbi:MAG: cyclic nucleotide-binding domain-containing protein [Deltaproteobacteria bacterium]|nr:cyclic nucleotide-binding domain-containing protein [Deltaproteobacteria bacterium]